MNLIEKTLVGAYSIVYNNKYHTFPKIAPIMMIALPLMGYFQKSSVDVPALFYTGLALFLIGLLGFFYFDIFPKRKPKTKEESMKYTTVINEKKSK